MLDKLLWWWIMGAIALESYKQYNKTKGSESYDSPEKDMPWPTKWADHSLKGKEGVKESKSILEKIPLMWKVVSFTKNNIFSTLNRPHNIRK